MTNSNLAALIEANAKENGSVYLEMIGTIEATETGFTFTDENQGIEEEFGEGKMGEYIVTTYDYNADLADYDGLN